MGYCDLPSNTDIGPTDNLDLLDLVNEILNEVFMCVESLQRDPKRTAPRASMHSALQEAAYFFKMLDILSPDLRHSNHIDPDRFNRIMKLYETESARMASAHYFLRQIGAFMKVDKGEMDDVFSVYSNAEVSDVLSKKLGEA